MFLNEFSVFFLFYSFSSLWATFIVVLDCLPYLSLIFFFECLPVFLLDGFMLFSFANSISLVSSMFIYS